MDGKTNDFWNRKSTTLFLIFGSLFHFLSNTNKKIKKKWDALWVEEFVVKAISMSADALCHFCANASTISPYSFTNTLSSGILWSSIIHSLFDFLFLFTISSVSIGNKVSQISIFNRTSTATTACGHPGHTICQQFDVLVTHLKRCVTSTRISKYWHEKANERTWQKESVNIKTIKKEVKREK